MRSFLNLEQERATRDLSRIDQALDQINHSLYTFTADWHIGMMLMLSFKAKTLLLSQIILK
jgi:hypothetical protein